MGCDRTIGFFLYVSVERPQSPGIQSNANLGVSVKVLYFIEMIQVHNDLSVSKRSS